MLKNTADIRALLYIGIFITIRCYELITGSYAWYWFFPITLMMFLSMVIMHNHLHHRMFKSRKISRAFDYVLSVLAKISFTEFYTGHMINHHHYVDNEKDWFHSKLVNYRWNLLNLIIFPFIAANTLRKHKPLLLRKPMFKKLRIRQRNETIVVVIVYLTIFIFDPFNAFIYWYLPSIAAKWIVIAFNLLQHDGCDPLSKYNHSVNYKGKWLNWLILNNGFHTIHHNKPAIHWSLLPKIHKQKIEPYINSKLEISNFPKILFYNYIWPGKRFNPLKK